VAIIKVGVDHIQRRISAACNLFLKQRGAIYYGWLVAHNCTLATLNLRYLLKMNNLHTRSIRYKVRPKSSDSG